DGALLELELRIGHDVEREAVELVDRLFAAEGDDVEELFRRAGGRAADALRDVAEGAADRPEGTAEGAEVGGVAQIVDGQSTAQMGFAHEITAETPEGDGAPCLQ